jgi:hypothetical protein
MNSTFACWTQNGCSFSTTTDTLIVANLGRLNLYFQDRIEFYHSGLWIVTCIDAHVWQVMTVSDRIVPVVCSSL